jgi:hypothetical protein
VRDVLLQHRCEVAWSGDQEVVETFAARVPIGDRSRAVPAASAAHGAEGRTSPSTTGETGWAYRHRTPAVRPLRQPALHRQGRRYEIVRRNIGKVAGGGGTAELAPDLGGDVGGDVGREVGLRDALQDRAAECAVAPGMTSSAAIEPAPADWASPWRPTSARRTARSLTDVDRGSGVELDSAV